MHVMRPNVLSAPGRLLRLGGMLNFYYPMVRERTSLQYLDGTGFVVSGTGNMRRRMLATAMVAAAFPG